MSNGLNVTMQPDDPRLDAWADAHLAKLPIQHEGQLWDCLEAYSQYSGITGKLEQCGFLLVKTATKEAA